MQDDKDLSSLKALAEACNDGLGWWDSKHDLSHVSECGTRLALKQKDIDLIAAANPQAILSLISRIEQQAAKLTGVVGWLETNQPDVFQRGLWDAINASTASDSADAASRCRAKGAE